ncbi:MAG: S8 family peptidase [Clostridium sp.]|nr:S8 family peptidase [Clostridium sp.]
MAYGDIPFVYGLMQDTLNVGAGGAAVPFDPNALIESGILEVQGEPLSLTGRGVLIGFVDTGIRYELDVFRRSDGTTRIVSIWDQETDRIYMEEEINDALRDANPRSIVPVTDESGHGTAMASVAAGSRVDGGRSYIGAAPDSGILVVKLKQAPREAREYYLVPNNAVCYSETEIDLGLQFLDEQAERLGLPLVICIGLGTNLSSHTGTSTLERTINRIAVKIGRAIVICSGNEGNKQHHFAGCFNRSVFQDEIGKLRRDVEIRVSEGVQGFALSVWGTQPYQFQFSLRSPGGETVRDIRPNMDGTMTYRFVYERTTLYLDAERVETGSGAQLLFLRFVAPTPGIWTLIVTEEERANYALFHAWLPIDAFLTAPVTFLEPSPYITLTDPSVAWDALGVSTYDDLNNSFYPESGRGYTRDGRVKPDLAAPGVQVSTAVGKRSGSSIAASVTAGGVAQFLQWAVTDGNLPWINSTNVKNYLVRGAVRDLDIVYPSREWGYGRLSISGVFERLAEL